MLNKRQTYHELSFVSCNGTFREKNFKEWVNNILIHIRTVSTDSLSFKAIGQIST